MQEKWISGSSIAKPFLFIVGDNRPRRLLTLTHMFSEAPSSCIITDTAAHIMGAVQWLMPVCPANIQYRDTTVVLQVWLHDEAVTKHSHSLHTTLPTDKRRQKVQKRSRATHFQGESACLLLRQVESNPCDLLSRQVGFPMHHWCYTTVVWCLEYRQEVGYA